MAMETKEIPGNLAEMTVNEIVGTYPSTISIFNEFGIDSCCGGGVQLAVAAERDNVDTDDLFRRLASVIGRA